MNFEVCEVMANVEYFDELAKKKFTVREFVPVNTKGMETIENVDIANDIIAFSTNKDMRLVALKKQMYRLTLASYKELKKELTKRGIIWKFDSSRRV